VHRPGPWYVFPRQPIANATTSRLIWWLATDLVDVSSLTGAIERALGVLRSFVIYHCDPDFGELVLLEVLSELDTHAENRLELRIPAGGLARSQPTLQTGWSSGPLQVVCLLRLPAWVLQRGGAEAVLESTMPCKCSMTRRNWTDGYAWGSRACCQTPCGPTSAGFACGRLRRRCATSTTSQCSLAAAASWYLDHVLY
jgi:hypothetical protein